MVTPRLADPSARGSLGIALAAALFVAVGLLVFGSTGHDDSHITYWAAHALAELGQMVNYNGDRVEQSSSLAQVVLLAIAEKTLPLPLPTLGPLSSILFGVLAIVLAARLARRVVVREGCFAPVAAALATATTPHFVYWGFGGLESTLVAAAACGVVLAFGAFLGGHDIRRGEAPVAPRTRRQATLAAVAMAAYLAARPESPMVLGCLLAAAVAHAALRARATLRPALVLCAIGAVETGALIGFRLAYFGSAFPNPVTTKASSLDPLGGLRYLRDNTVPTTLWLFVALGAGTFVVLRAAARRGAADGAESALPIEALLAAAFGAAYLGFIVLIGGDWMIGGRFLAHMVPMAAVVLAFALDGALGERRQVCVGVLALVLASNAAGIARLASGLSSGRPVWTTSGVRPDLEARLGAAEAQRFSWFETTNLVHLRDTTVAVEMERVVAAIRAVEPDHRVVVMSTQAGMVPYYLGLASYGHLRFIDGCSLVTRDFMPCLPKRELLDHPACRMLDYATYFNEAARIDATCGSERPDVVFGLTKRNIESVLERAGYEVIYDQRGPMRSGPHNLFGDEHTFRADEIIAVDREVAKRAGLVAKPAWTWDVGYRRR